MKLTPPLGLITYTSSHYINLPKSTYGNLNTVWFCLFCQKCSSRKFMNDPGCSLKRKRVEVKAFFTTYLIHLFIFRLDICGTAFVVRVFCTCGPQKYFISLSQIHLSDHFFLIPFTYIFQATWFGCIKAWPRCLFGRLNLLLSLTLLYSKDTLTIEVTLTMVFVHRLIHV